MTDETVGPFYSFRRNILTGKLRFHLGADAIFWEDKHRKGGIAYADVQMLRLYDFFRAICSLQPQQSAHPALLASVPLGVEAGPAIGEPWRMGKMGGPLERLCPFRA